LFEACFSSLDKNARQKEYTEEKFSQAYLSEGVEIFTG
jgi:hypothetical protein